MGTTAAVNAKRAIEVSIDGAKSLLNLTTESVEEIERRKYHGREVWSITLSFSRNEGSTNPLAIWSRSYKRFLVDAETGELLGIKLRADVRP